MVGFERPASNIKFHELDYAIAGAVSGFATRTLFQPLDVIKIRFQLQIEPISASRKSKYKGMIHAFRCIRAEEGIQALWKGIVPAQFLSTTYGALQFTVFEVLTHQASEHLPEKLNSKSKKPLINFTCGALAGGIATTGSFPFDVMRTRLVAQGEPKIYRNIVHAIITMLRTEGPLSFWKGLTPTLVQIMPNAGAQFAFYRLFQGLWNYCFQYEATAAPGAVQSTFCGAASGITAKMFIYPLDLIKKRIQVQGFEEARKAFGSVRRYTGLIHCASCILREEGILGLYKGFWPSLLKAAFTTGSHFLYYEQTLKVLVYLHSKINDE